MMMAKSTGREMLRYWTTVDRIKQLSNINTSEKKNHFYPRNCAPAGPTSTSRLARPSPSTIGGGDASLCLLTSRQVILVGAVHFLGGMMMRMPLWRLPLMEPPLASTMKLTRNLKEKEKEGGQEETKSDRGKREVISQSSREAKEGRKKRKPETQREG